MRYQHIDLSKRYKYHIDYVRVLDDYVFVDICANIYYLTEDDEPTWVHSKTIYFMIKPVEHVIEIHPNIISDNYFTLVNDILNYIHQTYMPTCDILEYTIFLAWFIYFILFLFNQNK